MTAVKFLEEFDCLSEVSFKFILDFQRHLADFFTGLNFWLLFFCPDRREEIPLGYKRKVTTTINGIPYNNAFQNIKYKNSTPIEKKS